MAWKLTALYYPHIAIESEDLLKQALLMWDEVHLISPFNALPRVPDDPVCRAAFKALAAPAVPTEEDMRAVHDAVIELAESDLPDWFFPERVNKSLHYTLYPGKLLPETWEALQRTKLARPIVGDIDPPMPRSAIASIVREAEQKAYEMTEAFGLTVLSLLAECCAGSTKQLVTDETDSYIALDRYYKLIGGAKLVRFWHRSSYERLATLSMRTADVSNVSLERLVEIRNEEGARPQLRAMRHSYVTKLDSYVERLSKEARSKRDIQEIERVFEQEVADDIGLLKEELKDEAKKVIFSKEAFVAGAIIAAGTFVEPVSASIAAAAVLGKVKVDYRTARNRTLQNHAMSWLYETKKIKTR